MVDTFDRTKFLSPGPIRLTPLLPDGTPDPDRIPVALGGPVLVEMWTSGAEESDGLR